MFTSDNGGLHVLEFPGTPATHNTPFRAGKGYLYEGGLREPLLVRWPGVVAGGSTCETPVVLTDLFPTLLEAAGVDTANTVGPVDGIERCETAPRRVAAAAHAVLALSELHESRWPPSRSDSRR